MATRKERPRKAAAKRPDRLRPVERQRMIKVTVHLPAHLLATFARSCKRSGLDLTTETGRSLGFGGAMAAWLIQDELGYAGEIIDAFRGGPSGR